MRVKGEATLKQGDEVVILTDADNLPQLQERLQTKVNGEREL